MDQSPDETGAGIPEGEQAPDADTAQRWNTPIGNEEQEEIASYSAHFFSRRSTGPEDAHSLAWLRCGLRIGYADEPIPVAVACAVDRDDDDSYNITPMFIKVTPSLHKLLVAQDGIQTTKQQEADGQGSS